MDTLNNSIHFHSLLVNSVSKENWFALLDNLVAATTLQQSQKKGRAFVALVTTEKHKMEQLTFDINDYKQQRLTKVRPRHYLNISWVVFRFLP